VTNWCQTWVHLADWRRDSHADASREESRSFGSSGRCLAELRELRGRVGRDCPSPKFHPPTWRLSETLGWQCVVDQTALPAWRRRVSHRAVVRFYNQRGTAERWIKEGKTATHWTRLSCHRFRANEVRLLLGVIAYNLGNLLCRLVLPVAIRIGRSRASSNACSRPADD
jgi:hypothetical protein